MPYIETLHRPGAILDMTRVEELRAQILALNLRLSDAPAFRANWRARIGTFFDDLEWLDLAWDGDRLIGHYGMRRLRIGRSEVLHVDNFTVDPDVQGQGIGRALTGRSNLRLIMRSLGRPLYVVARTQNPVVGAETWAAFESPDHHYPCFDGRPSSPELSALAAQVAAELWPDKVFDAESGVLEGAYGGRFLPTAPTRNLEVAAYFDRHIDLDRGDTFVQIMRLSPRAWLQMARYFGRHLLRRLLPGRERAVPATDPVG